jgi:hypothetical protein
VASRYQILDEPLPGPLAAYAVNPMWPLLAQMLAGSWLALPWFAFNGFALGSPTRLREALLALAGLGTTAALAFGLLVGADSLSLTTEQVRYLLVGLVFVKLCLAYGLFLLQRRTFGIFEFYGGTVRNPLVVLIAGALARPVVLAKLQSELIAYLALS